MTRRPWPGTVDDLLGHLDDAIEPRGQDRWVVGRRGVARLGGCWPGQEDHRRFLERLGEAAGFDVPVVVGSHDGWLVTELPEGLRADRPDRHPEPGRLAGCIGAGLAELHRLSPALLGDRHPSASVGRWEPVIDRCRSRVEAGLVDPSALPAPYDRYRAAELLDLLEDGRAMATDGSDDQPVLCHGSPTADRFLVDGDRFVGFDGLASALVADRHLDLAIAHISVADVLGVEAVYAFYEGYGSDPDLARLDRGILARHLLVPSDASR